MFPHASRYGQRQLATAHFVPAFRTIGPAIDKNIVQPFFQQRRAIEPEHGKLQDNLVMCFDQRLLTGDVKLPVWVGAVKIVDSVQVGVTREENPDLDFKSLMELANVLAIFNQKHISLA